MSLIYLATHDDWCTLSLADSVPDFCAIQTAYPLITLYDVMLTPDTDEESSGAQW